METDWQLNFKSMKERNAHLFATGMRADCRFRLNDADDNEKILTAHKIILSTASPIFEHMFFGKIPEKTDPIPIDGIEASDFYDLLFFVYCDTISISSIEKAQNLFFAAQRFMLDQLMKTCIDFIIQNLKVDNVFENCSFAYLIEDESLQATCFDLIRTQTSAVLRSPAILNVGFDVLNSILDQSHLSIQSELELFNALNSYAKFYNYFVSDLKQENSTSTTNLAENDKCLDLNVVERNLNMGDVEEAQQKDVSVATVKVSKETNTENIDIQMKTANALIECKRVSPKFIRFYKIVKKIRFLTMTTLEFASGPAISELLSTKDALAIFACIANPELVKSHFPKGFVSLKKRRC